MPALFRFLFDRRDGSTRALLWICCIDFLLMVALDRRIPIGLFAGNFGPLGGNPSLLTLLKVGGIWQGASDVQPWRLLSAVYVHLGLLHLGFNMAALWSIGRAVEHRFGGARMILAFVLSGFIGFVASRLFFGPVSPPTAGASGAIFGFIGLRVGELASRKDPQSQSLLFETLAYAVGLALLFSVNNAAHAGGFVAGLPLGYALDRERFRGRREMLLRWLATGALALSVVSIALCLFTTA